VSNASLELQKTLLEKLANAKGKKLGGAKLTVPKNLRKSLGADDAAVREAIDGLVREQYVTRTKSGGGVNYRLTREGEAHLASLEPDTLLPNGELFEYQRAFVLLKFFTASDRRLTQPQLEQRLGKMTGTMGFGEGRDGDGPDSRLVGHILRGFVREKALVRDGDRYELTEQGEELLGASDQYPGAEFTLTGREFNRICEAVRHGGFDAQPPEQARPAPKEQAPAAPVQPEPVEVKAPVTLTTSVLLELVEELRSERYLRTGMVPIWDLRRQVAARIGQEAATHATLDPLLKQLRRQDRVRLVSIADRSRATTDQLDDSIPGENETFFYVEFAHEYAQ
jgi:DNA-binding MarR family transcriptional regulator